MSVSARLIRSLWVVAAAVTLLLVPHDISAHPMGNFSINHYGAIRIDQGDIEIQYLIDMAEIPTFQELRQNKIVAQSEDPQVRSYLSDQAERLKSGLTLALNGQSLPLELVSSSILFSRGAADLPTMKIGAIYRARCSSACTQNRRDLEYHDANFAGRLGWKEVVVSPGQGITIKSSSAPLHDRSNQLSKYPTDLIHDSPQDLEAKIVYAVERLPGPEALGAAEARFAVDLRSVTRSRTTGVGDTNNPVGASTSGSLGLKPNGEETPRSAFTELMAHKESSVVAVLIAAAIAAGLGAVHALEPGHGKTIVAAYLVGSRGTAWHALLLGIVVTVSHTAGVYLLGGITLYAQEYLLPDRVYPILSVLSGILIAGMGLYLLLERCVGAELPHRHVHGVSRSENSPQESLVREGEASARQLLLLGFTGGIIPCPAALVVLLSAAAVHRISFGLYLILAFSIGLAAVLIALGLAAVYSARLLSRLRPEGPMLQRWLPIGSASLVIALGCGIAIRGFV